MMQSYYSIRITIKVDIANNTPFARLRMLDLVKADVNDSGPLLHHVCSDQAGNPSSNYQDVCILCKWT